MVLYGPTPKPFIRRAMGSEPIQGNERGTYVGLERLASVNMGSAKAGQEDRIGRSWRAGCWETCTSGSEGGHWKSAACH